MNGIISNIANIHGSGQVKLQAVKVPKTLPKVNSFVKIEVLENVKGNYKILVNGSLFQSKLPVKAKAGDVLFAQVLSSNPLTLSLDNFLASKLGEAGLVNLVFAKLGLKKTELGEKFIARLLKSKKHLSRQKIKEALDFINDSNLHFDEIQFAFLSAYLWDDNGETFTEKKNIYRRVFDLNFEELSEAIYKKTVWLSSQNLDMKFYDYLKSKLIFDYDNFERRNDFNALFGKVKNAIELADFLEKYASKELLTLSDKVIGLKLGHKTTEELTTIEDIKTFMI